MQELLGLSVQRLLMSPQALLSVCPTVEPAWFLQDVNSLICFMNIVNFLSAFVGFHLGIKMPRIPADLPKTGALICEIITLKSEEK